MAVGGKVVLIWVSIVEVPPLGLLLDRNFLDAAQAVIDFALATLTCRALDVSSIRLERLMAGHLWPYA